MYQVLLVDDEPWVLRGLTEGIPWAQLGFEICAQTSDPTEALTILLDRQPDLVVTDIKMPGISGMDKRTRITGIPIAKIKINLDTHSTGISNDNTQQIPSTAKRTPFGFPY